MRLVKLMFLISKDLGISSRHPVYDFIPYRFGPFSFEMYHDLTSLERRGHIQQDDETIFPLKGMVGPLDGKIEAKVSRKVSRAKDVNDKALVDQIYHDFPAYTIFSEIDRRMDYVRDRTGIASIGYQGSSIDKFLERLIQGKVHRVVDVRRNPFSMKYPFSKSRLSDILSKVNIGYSHFPQLGISKDRRRGLSSYSDYQALFRQYSTEIGDSNPYIDELFHLAEKEMIAIMCYEKDPRFCHRGVITDILIKRGLRVMDI